MSTDIREGSGERLRRLRKKRGWTQAKMSQVLGLDRSYLAEIEGGKRRCNGRAPAARLAVPIFVPTTYPDRLRHGATRPRRSLS